MTEKILAVVVSFIIAVISASGYAGVALLMAIESACIPLPSEVIMPFAGYLVSTGRFNLFLVATAGAIGCNLGSIVAYWIGAWAGRPFVERFGKFVLVDVHDLARATAFFEKYGSITVVGFDGLPATLGGVKEGTIASTVVQQPYLWAYEGMKLGQQWDSNPAFKEAFHRFHLAVEIVLLVGIIWFVWTHLISRKRAETA